ncbi:prepilin-type N-terminal cleavage/methylation domain-containing protein [bacterium BD-1]|nr:prepilin-type N-terminal cleavage/methylation domain-containing protein [Ottowia caeni]
MQANISRSGHHLGFTLIEVLVALSIMALMALMTWRGIDGMARAQEATRQYTDDVLALQAGLGQWRADLDAMMVWQQAVNTTNPSSNSSPVPQEVNRSLTWDGNTLRITRLTAEDAAAGVRVVAWTRRASTGQWLRWQSPPLQTTQAWEAAWNAAARWGEASSLEGAPAGGAQETAIVAAVDWQLYYFRNNAWTNPLSSGSEGANATSTRPDGIRLMITLAQGQAMAGALEVDWVRPDFGSIQ